MSVGNNLIIEKMPTDFEIAFANARKQGLAQFTFEGKQYTTQLKGEPSKLLQLAMTDNIRKEVDKDINLRFVSNYNTGLKQDEFNEFWAWANKRYGGHDNVLREMGAYDIQGAWKDIRDKKIDFDPVNGHLPDTYKKPNHPTFSNESRYHSKETPGGKWQQKGNRWQYYPSNYTLKNFGSKHIQNYLAGDKETDVMWNNLVDY